MNSTLSTFYPQFWPESPPLCLPAPPSLAPGEEAQSQVFCGLFIILKSLENAGRSFFEKYEVRDLPLSSCSTPADSSTTQEAGSNPCDETYENNESNETSQTTSSRWARGPSMGWLKTAIEGPNLYDILEIDENATVNDIRKQYKLLAVKYHPDKNMKEQNDEKTDKQEDKHFLKIQEAYEILSNEKFRKMYDSALPFDESIPDISTIKDEESFYAKFGPVFKRNAQWSVKKQVPNLGNAKTPIVQVNNFYKFWFLFETNRDFSLHDECDLNEAENREERRWMERENKKIHRRYLKAENQRIQQLVNLAYNNDPRILRDTQMKEEQKRLEREKKLAKIRQATLEEEQRKEEERKKEEEKSEQEKNNKLKAEQKKYEKQRMSKRRQRVRHLFDPIASMISSYDLQCICTELSKLQLHNLCDQIYEVYDLNIKSENDEDLKTTLEHIQKKGTDEEIEFSAIFKEQLKTIFYNRLNPKEDNTCQDTSKGEEVMKSNKQPLQEKKEDIKNEKNEKENQPTFWSQQELTLLSKAIQRYPGGTVNRWESIANFIGTKSAPQIIEKSKELNLSFNKKPTVKAENTKINVIESETGTTKIPFSEPAFKDLNDSDWTVEQQRALELALKKFPTSLPATKRWQCISNEIPGKSTADCMNRCKQIRLLLQNESQK